MDEVLDFFGDVMLCFIPLFVTVDAPGALPIVISFVVGMGKKEQPRMIHRGILQLIERGTSLQ